MLGYEIMREIENEIRSHLDKCGVMYRLFSRSKSEESMKSKIERTPGKYTQDGEKKIQDILGFRIVFYFLEDVRTFSEYMKVSLKDRCCDVSDSEADFKNTKHKNVEYTEIFGPQRLNLVFKMNKERSEDFRNDINNSSSISGYASIIDDAYEIQFRSVLSEGWHEIEHDLRYKCKGGSMWKYCESESRTLNGIYASLETNEVAMELLFDRIAYINYKNGDWEDMIRNHFRISIDPYAHLSKNIKDQLDINSRIAKKVLSIPRKELQLKLLYAPCTYPLNYDNILFLINRMFDEPDDKIVQSEPVIIKEKLDDIIRNQLPQMEN